MKSYTDIEQSKKLTEILSIESSDMYWDLLSKSNYAKVNNIGYCLNRTCIYAWSLTALLQILPIKTYIEIDNVCCTLAISRDTLGKWFVSYHNRSYGSSLITCSNKELLDACYEMVVKLNELKML
jgi:hypothetical protein